MYAAFAPPPPQSTVARAGGTVRRAGTIVRSPLEKKNAHKPVESEMAGYEVRLLYYHNLSDRFTQILGI